VITFFLSYEEFRRKREMKVKVGHWVCGGGKGGLWMEVREDNGGYEYYQSAL
jgi:hypothetical protein